MSNKSITLSDDGMVNRVHFSNYGFREKRSTLFSSKVTVVLGTQWGDEGKGKIIDMLASDFDICCRCQGGNNSSHSVVVDGTEFHFHLLPSGVIHEKCVSVIGNGVVIYLPGLFSEIEDMKEKGITQWKNRLIISDRCHLVFDFHQKFDEGLEYRKGTKPFGTQKKGIGPAYTSKASRNGIRICDLLGDFELFVLKFKAISAIYRKLFEIEINEQDELDRYKNYIPKLRPFVKDTIYYLHRALQQGKKIIIEGANAAMLDIDFGTYPYVSSNNCSIGGVLTGLGLPAQCIGEVIGVVKSYTTRVGNGPFPTEQLNAIGEILEQRSSDIPSMKKKRRCGWLDLVLLKYTSYINGYTAMALTKLDIFDTFKEIKIGVAYRLDGKILDYFPSTAIDLENIEVQYVTLPGWETSTVRKRQFNDLPKNAQEYIKYIENEIGVPIKWIGVGKGRDAILNVHPIIHI